MTPDTPTPAEPLKPCPFCGSEPIIQDIEPHAHGLVIAGERMPDHPGSSVIECRCGCGLIDDDRASVIAHWNRRAEIAQPATPEPAKRGQLHPEAPYSLHFEDGRDFCRFASLLIGAAYTSAPDAVARLSAPRRGDCHGDRTWGRVFATQPATHVAHERVELAAKAIFEHWEFGAPVAWVDQGNSDMQDRARRFARAALATQVAFSSSNASNTLGDAAARPGLSAGAPIPIAAGSGLSDSTSTEN